MNRTNTKRQLLADLLEGKTDRLKEYRQAQFTNPYSSWIIDARAVGGTITTTLQGEKIQISEHDFEQLPRNAPIWRIVDYSGGKTPPPVDE